MSGATDFDKFKDKSKSAIKAKKQQELDQERKKQREIEEEKKNRPDVKFKFVREEDEWAAIARYN